MLIPYQSQVQAFPLVLFVVLAGMSDWRERRIPNRWVAVATLAAIVLAASRGGAQLADSAAGLALGIAVLFPAFALHWLGAGDVKLMGGIGAFVGASGVLRAAFYASLAGTLLALVFVVHARLTRSGGRVGSLPYGIAIALGALVTVWLDPRGDWAGF